MHRPWSPAWHISLTYTLMFMTRFTSSALLPAVLHKRPSHANHLLTKLKKVIYALKNNCGCEGMKYGIVKTSMNPHDEQSKCTSCGGKSPQTPLVRLLSQSPRLWVSIDMQSANSGCTDPKINVRTATCFFLRVRLWILQAKCADIFWELLHSLCCITL